MLENTAFLFGIYVMIATAGIAIISWIMSSIFKVNTQKISFLVLGETGELIRKKIKSTEVVLGWIPLGSSFEFSGMDKSPYEDESDSYYSPFDFKNKPKWIQILLATAGPLIMMTIGLILLINSSNLAILDIMTTYLKVSSFLLPLESANDVLKQAYSNSTFLAGCTFLITGIIGLIVNAQLPFQDSTTKTVISLIIQLFSLFITATYLRLIWMNFSFMNLIYYFTGIIIIGILSYLFALILVRMLPQFKSN